MGTPTRIKRRGLFSLILGGLVAAVSFAAVASADDISNNLDPTVDAVAEVMPLVLGGPNGTTQLYVVPRNGDGKSGCNLTGSTTLVVSVSSSNASVATVSPSPITFESCGDTPTLTVTPVGLGSATISVSQVSNNTGGTFNLAPAAFTVEVAPPPNTPPSVSVTGVSGGASYEIGAVPAAGCSVVDAEDGNSSFPATLSAISGPLAAYGLGTQTASCSYTDGGGLTASAAETYGIVDTVAPVITFASRTPAANSNGWNTGDVTVGWSCSDGGSGVVSGSVGKIVSTEGENQSATGTCEDRAGNTASDTQSGISIDKTKPQISGSRTPAANANGWNNTDVVVAFTCVDVGAVTSGIDTDTVAGATVTAEGENQSVTNTGACTDRAGNEADPATVGGISIDKTKPQISGSRTPAANANGWNNTDVVVTFTCVDVGAVTSGIDTDTVAGATVTPEGESQSVTNTGACSDKAGNEAGSASVGGISIDKTAPTAVASAAPGPNFNGWNNTDVTVSFSGTDGLSGIDSCSAPVVLAAEGTGLSASGTCSDKAGNVSEPAAAGGIKIDKTAPAVSVTGVSNGATYTLGSVPAAGCTTTDGLSGVAIDATLSMSGGPVGSITATCDGAEDNAGNTGSASVTYSVHYTWTGFFRPIDNAPTCNVVKAGSAIPVKFSLSGYQGPNPIMSGYPKATAGSCAGAPLDTVEETVTAGQSSISYDAATDQYTYVWKSDKAWAGKAIQLTVRLQDGTDHVARFSFTK